MLRGLRVYSEGMREGLHAVRNFGGGGLSATEHARATILLVEDDPTIASMLKDRLGAKGYGVWHAENGAEAEAIADEARPDAIIVDLMLPDVHGLVLCATLKEKRSAPII